MPKHSTVIVGLLPGQARRIADEFKQTGLKFIPRDRERELHVLTKDFDNVVVMTKFISHASWFLLPKDRIRPVNGGLSDLKRKLRSLLSSDSKPAAKSAQKEPYMPEAIDYSPLKNAAPGEVVRIVRPPTTTVKTFQKQLTAMRSYYRRMHAVETTQRILDDHAEVIIVSRGGVTADGMKEQAKTPAKESDKSAYTPSSDQAMRQFWSDAYLRLITSQPGATDETLAARADAAVQAYRQRFPS